MAIKHLKNTRIYENSSSKIIGKYHVFSFKVQFIKNHFFCPVRVGGGWGAIPQTRVYFIEQGSSENDGRSDVYDHLELKIVSYCCYPNCSHTNCGHFVNLGNLPEYT